jgi:hypothetical protein
MLLAARRAARDDRQTEGATMTDARTPHGESGARMSVDTDLVGVRLSDDSFRYMIEMLDQMPHAKFYRNLQFDPATTDILQVLRDFVAEVEPKGSLEAEPLLIIDAVTYPEGGYVARGDARLAASLQRADVPDVLRVAG